MKPHFSMEDTIAALATPPGEGGIGIVRLSGKKSITIADQIFESKSKMKAREQKNFTVRYGHVVTPTGPGNKIIDEALLTVMRSPKSYTGEDVVEISTHGGQAVLQEVLRLVTEAGARPAEPGEFTKRAFLNGRMDLLQAEAVLDLIQAKTAQALRWASSQLEGAFSHKIQGLKKMLLELLSHLEAQVDFPDDFPDTDTMKEIERKLSIVQTGIQALLDGARFGLLAKRGFKVAIWGRPNVGKSSLFNQLTGSSRVIVTPHPGTTRDVVEEEIAVGGFPVRLQDTAGMQETENPIEKEGVERSRKSMNSADLVIFVLDSSRDLSPQDRNLYEECREKTMILALNKSDLPPKIGQKDLLKWSVSSPVVTCSCLEEQGVEALRTKIFHFIHRGSVDIPDETVVSTVRQKNLLSEAGNDLSRAQGACSKCLSSEFIASDVKRALDQLYLLTGETTTDDVLELLFSKFCIGK